MERLWLFSQTRLGPGPRQQGRQVQGVGSLVCTSKARKMRVPLARARGGAPQQVWLPCFARSAEDACCCSCFQSIPGAWRSGFGGTPSAHGASRERRRRPSATVFRPAEKLLPPLSYVLERLLADFASEPGFLPGRNPVDTFCDGAALLAFWFARDDDVAVPVRPPCNVFESQFHWHRLLLDPLGGYLPRHRRASTGRRCGKRLFRFPWCRAQRTLDPRRYRGRSRGEPPTDVRGILSGTGRGGFGDQREHRC